MRRRAMITSAFTCASVLLLVVGVHPAAAASSPAEVLQQQGFAAFEWYPLSQANAKVSDQRLNFLRRDGFKTIYADISEHLGVADQPDSRTQRTRLSQLTSDLKRFVSRASNLGLAVHGVSGGPNWTDASHRYLGPDGSRGDAGVRSTAGVGHPAQASRWAAATVSGARPRKSGSSTPGPGAGERASIPCPSPLAAIPTSEHCRESHRLPGDEVFQGGANLRVP
jgi:hypothetical protein